MDLNNAKNEMIQETLKRLEQLQGFKRVEQEEKDI